MRFAAFLLAMLLFAGCAPERCERVEWTTMSTIAAVQVRSAAVVPVRDSVRGVFAAVERLLNAYDPDSELSRLAPLSDAEILRRCDPSVSNCYAAAFRLAKESGGAFNPRWRGPGTLDLGAIAKGFAVDLACEKIRGEAETLVDLGGNLRSAGGEWKVGVAGSDAVIMLTNGMACATSAEYFRGKHIYDARTGKAVSNDVVSVTVVHPSSAMLADGLSTVLFILGREQGERFLREHYPEAEAIFTSSSPSASPSAL